MKTLFLLSFVLISVATHGQVFVGDTLNVKDIRQKYVTLRVVLTNSKDSGKKADALVDIGSYSTPDKLPYLTNGHGKIELPTATGFINLMDTQGFEFVSVERQPYGTGMMLWHILFRKK